MLPLPEPGVVVPSRRPVPLPEVEALVVDHVVQGLLGDVGRVQDGGYPHDAEHGLAEPDLAGVVPPGPREVGVVDVLRPQEPHVEQPVHGIRDEGVLPLVGAGEVLAPPDEGRPPGDYEVVRVHEGQERGRDGPLLAEAAEDDGAPEVGEHVVRRPLHVVADPDGRDAVPDGPLVVEVLLGDELGAHLVHQVEASREDRLGEIGVHGSLPRRSPSASASPSGTCRRRPSSRSCRIRTTTWRWSTSKASA